MATLHRTPLWQADVTVDGTTRTVMWDRIEVEPSGLVTHMLQLDDGSRDSAYLEAACALRRDQLRAELTIPSLEDLRALADFIESLYLRSMEGEFVGQHDEKLLYVQQVASLVGCTAPALLFPAIELLSNEQRIALNGMILWDWQSIADSRDRAQKRTGHWALAVSDFGYWSCTACGKRGDDYENPADAACVAGRPEQTGIMYA